MRQTDRQTDRERERESMSVWCQFCSLLWAYSSIGVFCCSVLGWWLFSKRWWLPRKCRWVNANLRASFNGQAPSHYALTMWLFSSASLRPLMVDYLKRHDNVHDTAETGRINLRLKIQVHYPNANFSFLLFDCFVFRWKTLMMWTRRVYEAEQRLPLVPARKTESVWDRVKCLSWGDDWACISAGRTQLDRRIPLTTQGEVVCARIQMVGYWVTKMPVQHAVLWRVAVRFYALWCLRLQAL